MIAASALALASCQSPKQPALDYPQAKTVESSSNYFGHEVAEPYAWLENDTSSQTEAWVKAENQLTQQFIQKIPCRNAYRERLAALANYEKMSVPQKEENGFFYFKNNGLQNQNLLFFAKELGGKEELILDPNTLSKDGTVALSDYSISKDGKYMAYAISRSGSDWTEIYVMDLQTKEILPDHVLWAKFTTIAWQGNGFYYSGYEAPTKGKEYSNINEYQKIFYHTIGTDYSEDQLIYEDKTKALCTRQVSLFNDEKIMLINESEGTSGNRLIFKDYSQKDQDFITLINDLDDETIPVGYLNGKIYLLTTWNAPNNRLLEMDPQNPSRSNWKEIIPETSNKIVEVKIANNQFLVNYLQDAKNHLYKYATTGERLAEIKLAKEGSINNLSGSKKSQTLYFNFESFTEPEKIMTCDLENNQAEIFWAPKLQFNPSEFVENQVFITSKDGTQIPMTIIHKKGLEKDGNTPTTMYGYGGFDISLSPYFKVRYIPYLENGGIYCVVNLRGGGEYGSKWHEQGIKMNKQNVFDDFIAATEYMIKEGYTNPTKIASNGGSNGGLLVGATMVQRPDLYAVAIPEVGVLDMMKYHQFTIGWAWASDYGTSKDSKEMAEYLLGYSPLHNIKEGVKYPATLIMTGDHDDRVVPAHSFKFAATLQAENRNIKNANPTLIRIDSKAGHGAGKPISKILDAEADKWAFLLYNMNESYVIPEN